jgi:hypothetical protein
MKTVTTRQWLIRAVAIIVLAAATLAWFQHQRLRSDAMVAADTVSIVVGALQEKASGTEAGGIDAAVPFAMSNMFASNIASRVQASPYIEQAWLAEEVAHFLLEARRSGTTQAPVDSVPGARRALVAYPDLKTHVETVGGVERFSDTTETVTFLLTSGVNSANKAGESILAQYGATGLDLKSAFTYAANVNGR